MNQTIERVSKLTLHIGDPIPTSVRRGHEIMDRLRAMCASFDKETEHRSLIHIILSSAIARTVYGPDVDRFADEIKAHNNFETLQDEIAATLPSRCGKSRAISMWIAAAMLAVPGIDIACFSNTVRLAGVENGMLNVEDFILCSVRDALVDHFKIPAESVAIDNEECVQIVVDGNKRTLHSYPGAHRTMRGVSGNVVIVEESAYVPDRVFREAIAPMMTRANTRFVALNTQGDGTRAWFEHLANKNPSSS